jgi:hypothetical protein
MDNIQMDLRQNGVVWTELIIPGRDQWILVHTVMSLRVKKKISYLYNRA